MGYLFENMEHMDIQEERRKTQEAGKALEQTESELAKSQVELAAALKELERYRAADRENKA